MARLRQAIDEATRALADAGVASARVDAEELAAHAAGTDRGRLALLDVLDDDFFRRYARTGRRALEANSVAASHRNGGIRTAELDVGPGVFIPRPETEALLEWAAAQHLPAEPLIVDLCTGSGALAVALARHWPTARVIGVDISAAALAYAQPQQRGHVGRTPARRRVAIRSCSTTSTDVVDLDRRQSALSARRR